MLSYVLHGTHCVFDKLTCGGTAVVTQCKHQKQVQKGHKLLGLVEVQSVIQETSLRLKWAAQLGQGSTERYGRLARRLTPKRQLQESGACTMSPSNWQVHALCEHVCQYTGGHAHSSAQVLEIQNNGPC